MLMTFYHSLPHLILDISQLSDLVTELSKVRRGVVVLPLSNMAQEQAEELLLDCLEINRVLILNELFLFIIISVFCSVLIVFYCKCM